MSQTATLGSVAETVDRRRLAPLRWIRSLKARRKELFWVWITYQSVKGLTTTSLIWVPLIMWWSNGG